jgi:hypothetical protein
VTPWIRRRRRVALLLLLTAELLVAGWWRRPWTLAPIQTPYDYGTGHVTVVSERWRRFGALRHHFLPVLSIDPDLPEWPYRTLDSQEYTSVPPLAFILHYGATRLVPGVEPVLLGKLLAQLLIAASVLASAMLLLDVLGAWATLAALSFVIWSVPSLLWLANGYFAVNVGMAVELVLAAWCVAVASGARDRGSRAPIAMTCAIGAALAFLGGFADYLPLAANAIAAAGLFGLAAVSWRRQPVERWHLLASAAGVVIGSIGALVSTAILYGREMGFARYRDAITRRVAERSGDAPVTEHFDVIRRQMLTAWPPAVLDVLIVMLCFVIAWCVVSIARRRAASAAHAPIVVLLALAIGFLPSLFFHYRAVNYVRIHWWFAGTWTIGWALTVGACVFIAGRFGRAASLACTAVAVLIVAADVRFLAAQSADDPRAAEVSRYRLLGADLPRDEWPLVVTDVERAGLFEDFPFATAYLRRPILFRDESGGVRLPSVQEVHNGQPLRIGGEDVRVRLVARGGDVYVAYDPDARQCLGTDVPLSAWHEIARVRVCRMPAVTLVQRPETVLGPCFGPPDVAHDLRLVSSAGRRVVVSWAASGIKRYVLEAGTSRGQADVMARNLGPEPSYTEPMVKPGTYYVRVRLRNDCGAGPASNELTIVVE